MSQPGSAEIVTDLRAGDPALRQQRSLILLRAEAELARGDARAAIETFDRAAMMLHAPDTEMGLVRAYMQAGEYRKALAFCAHTAGAHLESAGAAALYAWLLRAGGQRAVADRTLDAALARSPRDPVAQAARLAFEQPAPVATGSLLETPHRMAPQATMNSGATAAPEAAEVVATGVLIDGGSRALVPSPSVGAKRNRALWVRNGLGRTSEAHVDETGQPLEAFGITVLRLAGGLEPSSEVEIAPRAPYAGSVGFVVEFAASARPDAAWPQLHHGFLGAALAGGAFRRLGIDVPAGPRGGPVFDAQGRLAGISLRSASGEAMMLPASTWAPALTPASASPMSSPTAPVAVTPELLYERALPMVLQVIVPR